MARAPFKLPNVFVGCPYGGKFPFAQFRSALEGLPFKWYFGDTQLTTKHLLSIFRTYFKAVDFCIFDISLWNPNVALELGLAEGMGVDYYILVNRKLSKGVPADIQGLQRIEYGNVNGNKLDDLVPSLIKYLVRDHTHPRNIYDALSVTGREKRYAFALRVLAHLRDNKRLTKEDAQRLTKGTHLREADRAAVLEIMEAQGLIGSVGSARGAKLMKSLFTGPITL